MTLRKSKTPRIPEQRFKYHPDRGRLRRPSGWYLEQYDTRLAQWCPIRPARPDEINRLEQS